MRIALHTRLAAGSEADYELAHTAVPAALVSTIRGNGVSEWTIWRSGRDLFHVLECEDYGWLLSELETLPVNVEWQARLAPLMEVGHDYSADGRDATLPAVWNLADEPSR